jgi:hypothetical protein
MHQDTMAAATTTIGFASIYLGLSPYMWQAKALLPLEKAGFGKPRVNITVAAPNGSGKDQVIIPGASYWWLFMNPRGQVVITTKSELQLNGQTLPSLNKHWGKFGWDKPLESPRYKLTTPSGGVLTAFVTKDPARAEGWHEKPGEPLLLIVNEAATVDDPIFTALDRCTPTAILLVSKCSYRRGRFFQTHQKLRHEWNCINAGLADCPHIPKSKIDFILSTYGPDHPVTRSTLYGEFMDQLEGDLYCLTTEDYLKCLDSPSRHIPGTKCGFFDFGRGKAENVFARRDGNKYWIQDAWHEVNEDAIVGRAMWLVKQSGLKPSQVAGDAAAKGILDKMAASGCTIGRQNFGAKDPGNIYQSWAAKAWIEGSQKVKNREVIIPEDTILQAQMTTRQKILMPSGKWGLIDKDIMEDEGIESPDRADAVFGCMAQNEMAALSPLYETDWFKDVPRKQPVGARVGI